MPFDSNQRWIPPDDNWRTGQYFRIRVSGIEGKPWKYLEPVSAADADGTLTGGKQWSWDEIFHNQDTTYVDHKGDIKAKEWRDKINGNSYFSSDITLNYGMDSQEIIKLPFQYGYGDQYYHASMEEVKNLFPRSNWVKKKYSSWEVKDKYKFIIRNSIQRNCLKKELNR